MIGTAILTGVALLSLWGNFEQYCENRKLLRQIEKLQAIIDRQVDQLNELRAELDSLHFWSFIKIARLKEKIERLASELDYNNDQLRALYEEAGMDPNEIDEAIEAEGDPDEIDREIEEAFEEAENNAKN